MTTNPLSQQGSINHKKQVLSIFNRYARFKNRFLP